MNTLEGKSVLLLAPNFFGYEFEIKKELEAQGASVYYYDERPKNDFITKALIRLDLKPLIAKKINDYYASILNDIKNIHLDYLFLVGPETISLDVIDTIISNNKGVKVLTYFWDSIKNKKNALRYLSKSERFFSFDSNDTKLNEQIEFLPLFYIKDYEKIKESTDFQYDLCFIGTAHSDRYKIVKNLEKAAKAQGLRVFTYFYSPSKTLFLYKKYLKSDFKGISFVDVSFKSLSKQEVVQHIARAKAVIDIQHPNQTGLTMRTIEALGAGRKLLTTNKFVADYDFFDKQNIEIFDREKPIVDFSFLGKGYNPIDNNTYQKYALRTWLHTIFS